MIDLGGADYAVGDPMRIRQILLNLIGNAIKFTRNGTITVEARRLPNDDMVEFRVTDTGIGIPVGDRERIFEDFVTLDATFSRAVGGTGLGLAIVPPSICCRIWVMKVAPALAPALVSRSSGAW